VRAAAVVLALVALVALASADAGDVNAADPQQELRTLERELGKTRARQSDLDRKAAAAANEAGKLRKQAIAVAARAQSHESAVAAIEEQMDALVATEVEKARWLAERRGQLIKMLAALQRLARHPPVALIALPVPPSDTVRSTMLLRAAVPELEAQARALSGDLDALSRVRAQIVRSRRALKTESAKLAGERKQLAALLEAKTRLVAETRARSRAAQARATQLGAEASDLRDLLARIAEARRQGEMRRRQDQEGQVRRRRQTVRLIPPAPKPAPAPKPSPPAAAPPVAEITAPPPIASATPETTRTARLAPAPGGQFGLPARGRLVWVFGQNDEFGQPSKGVRIRTLQGAQVVAPRAGEVVFAGPFRGLGRLLIIELNRQYHVLLAGMARIDVAVGDRVLAGEPVGVMAIGAAAKPALYVELRRNGRPINPLPWLAAGRTRIRG
jgi:septal ring factor EnvC (AmiA/AmiB activator)